MRLSISELLASGTCSWDGDGWRPVHHRALGQTVLLGDQRGVQAMLKCPSGVTGVWLLRHPWSGTVRISYASKSERVPLTADVQDLDFVVPLSVPGNLPAELQIIVDSDPGTPKSHAQVWLLGLTFNRLPLGNPKARTLSSTTRLISGEWGDFLVLSSDAEIPTTILNTGAWASTNVDVFKKHVKLHDCVLDIGAHVGHHSVVLSKLVGESGIVVAVEAQKVMYQLLNANCVINAAHNVQPVHMAASDRRRVVRMYPTDLVANNLGSLGINIDSPICLPDARGEVVAAACADDLVELYCVGRRVAFIKVDTQAYEKYVLLGLMRTITKDRPTILFEVAPYWMQRAGYDYREIYRLLQTLGYRFEHFIPLPFASDGVPDLACDNRAEWDTLAMPSE